MKMYHVRDMGSHVTLRASLLAALQRVKLERRGRTNTLFISSKLVIVSL